MSQDTTGQRPILEVNQRSEEHFLRSFASMKNANRSGWVTVLCYQRWQSQKLHLWMQLCQHSVLYKALAGIQTLNLDAPAPLMKLLELLNAV